MHFIQLDAAVLQVKPGEFYCMQVFGSMAGVQDSEAHFASRAREYGLPDACLDRLKALGISPLGHLAFAVFRPGSEFEERAFNDWATDVNNGVPLAMGAAAALRRLHFESVLTSTIRASVETPDQGTPKPIPFAEKSARMEQLRARFTGLNIHGTGEPSHALLDEVCSQFESRVLRYIEPQRCTSRELEITTGRSDKKLKLDASTLSIKETKSVPDEAISATLQPSILLCARVAEVWLNEFANLISFGAHEKLLRHLSVDPPVGFQATTLAQVLRADREVFSFMAQEIRDIRPTGDDLRPLDVALERALRDYSVAFHVVPLPKLAAKEDSAPTKRHTSEPYPQTTGFKGKGRGKSGKGGKSSGSNAAPKGFHGCVGRDAKNRPICFDYNISGCNKAPRRGALVRKEGTFAFVVDVSKTTCSKRRTVQTCRSPSRSD